MSASSTGALQTPGAVGLTAYRPSNATRPSSAADATAVRVPASSVRPVP
ncbi:hypothetical protein ACI784_24605 [Geodermatophilus sp. SYSU D01186]